MVTLYVMVGLPGAGKTTWSRANAERLGATVVGSDDVRRELIATGRDAANGDLVFAEVERRARSQLRADRSVILDATHALREYRTYTLRLAEEAAAWRVAVWIDVPVAVCLERHAVRTNLVFDDVRAQAALVLDLASRFEPPGPDEFDEVVRLGP